MERFDVLSKPSTDGDGIVTICVTGGIDLSVTDTLHEVVMESLRADTTRVLLDLHGITAVDAAGVGVLARMHQDLLEDGCVFEVHRVRPGVAELLTAAGLLPGPPCAQLNRTTPVLALFDQQMRDGRTPAQRFAAALDAAVGITTADKGNMQVFDHTTNCLRIAEQRGFDEPFLAFFDSVNDESCACGMAMTNRDLVVVDDVATSPVFAGTPACTVVLDADVRSVVSVPYCDPAALLAGVLSVHHRQPVRLTRHQQLLLRLVAERLGSSSGPEMS